MCYPDYSFQMAPDYDHLTLMQKVEVFEHALKNTNGDDLAKLLWLKSPSSEVRVLFQLNIYFLWIKNFREYSATWHFIVPLKVTNFASITSISVLS